MFKLYILTEIKLLIPLVLSQSIFLSPELTLMFTRYVFFQHYTSAESCMSAFKAPVDPSTVLGGFSGSNYTEVLILLS